MLLCHSMPDIASATFSTNLAGGGFVNETEDGLYDGYPARVARIQWANSVGTASDWVAATLLFGEATRIRVVGVYGLTLPIGITMIVTLLDGATEISAQSGPSVQIGQGGTIGQLFVFGDGLDPADRVRVQFVNDLDGTPAIAANEIFEVGEIFAMQAVELRLQADWTIDPVDPSEATLSRDSQTFVVEREPYRLFEGTLSVASFEEVYADGLDDAQDLMGLQAALAGDARCLAIPRWKGDTGVLYMPGIYATAIYGRGAISKIAHLGGDQYKAQIAVQEIPARNP